MILCYSDNIMKKTPIKKKVVKVVREVNKDPLFKIVIQIDAIVYKGEGETALEALQAVPAPELDYISSGSVTVTKGDKVREMLYSTIQLKRLLNPYHQEVLAHILTEGM